jgi:hypothetical protein
MTQAPPPADDGGNLSEALRFNYHTIRSFTSYAVQVDEETLEREISFHIDLGPHTERKGDSFPVWRVPAGRMAWLSDWSFNGGHLVTRELSLGGSLGRITTEGHYIFVLNAAVYSGEMAVYSPARPIRYLPGEWLAVCWHHMGIPLDVQVRATFRLVEVPAPATLGEYSTYSWWTHDQESFPGLGSESG